MHITVRYKPTRKDPYGQVERLVTPVERDFQHWRAGFKCVDGIWCLLPERWEKKDGNLSWHYDKWLGHGMLVHKGGSLADYEDYLSSLVAYVLIDGEIYWQNKEYQGKVEA